MGPWKSVINHIDNRQQKTDYATSPDVTALFVHPIAALCNGCAVWMIWDL